MLSHELHTKPFEKFYVHYMRMTLSRKPISITRNAINQSHENVNGTSMYSGNNKIECNNKMDPKCSRCNPHYYSVISDYFEKK